MGPQHRHPRFERFQTASYLLVAFHGQVDSPGTRGHQGGGRDKERGPGGLMLCCLKAAERQSGGESTRGAQSEVGAAPQWGWGFCTCLWYWYLFSESQQEVLYLSLVYENELRKMLFFLIMTVNVC